MSKNLEIPKEGPNSDVPQTKIAREMTGDDYRESLLTYAKLEEALKGNSGMIPKRPRVFRIADSLLKELNKLDNKSEEDPESEEARTLDQLHHQFGTDNVVDLAMILANMQLKKEEKERFRKIIKKDNLDNIKVRSTLTRPENTDTSELPNLESQTNIQGGSQPKM